MMWTDREPFWLAWCSNLQLVAQSLKSWKTRRQNISASCVDLKESQGTNLTQARRVCNRVRYRAAKIGTKFQLWSHARANVERSDCVQHKWWKNSKTSAGWSKYDKQVEEANKNIQDLQKPSSAVCHKVKSSPTPMHSTKDYRPNSGQCYRCKGTNHTASTCRYKSEKCHNCGKIGHIAQACHNARTKI